jgi:hypothetical protein
VSPHRRAAIAVLVTALVALSAPAVAGAATLSTATPGTSRVVEASDWSSVERSDPLDFTNAEDLSPVSQNGTSNLVVTDGKVAFDTTAGGWVEPVYALGDIPHGHDSTLTPIDGRTYTRLSARIYSGAATNQDGVYYWFSCKGMLPSCASATALTLKPGWNTYILDLTARPTYANNAPWGAGMTGFRIVPTNGSATPIHVEIDWMRFYAPTTPVTVSVAGGGTNDVWWDSDADPSNNGTAANPGRTAARIGAGVASGSSVSLDVGSLPPGTYRFYTTQGGSPGAYSSPLVVAARPQPTVITPSLTTGADYASSVRGDAWDFSQSSDVFNVANFVPNFGGGVMSATGAGTLNEPQFQLATAGSVDASRYHKLTFRISYDGPFGLQNAPGGGMVMRLIWGLDNGSGGTSWFNGQDVVVTPGWQTVSYDLRQDPNIIEDETDPFKVGWGTILSPRVKEIRFDPHEDPGGRSWQIDDVRLTADDVAAPGFTFQFADNAAQPGTTAEIWLDGDRSGTNGTRVLANVPVSAGTNSVTWPGGGIPAGTYWPHLLLRSSDGAVTTRYATGQIEVQPPPVNPFGSVDSTSSAFGQSRITGWAIDPDVPTQGVVVHVYSDGRFLGGGGASLSRPDIGSAFPNAGSNHGFDLTFPDTTGTHNVCAFALNVGAGTNSLLGCRSVTVRAGDPWGSVDNVQMNGPGTIGISGWAIDPDTSNPLVVHVYVNGAFAAGTGATDSRPDVGGAFPGYGNNHGYHLTVNAAGADNQVCVFAINSGPGNNTLLGCRNVRAAVDPFGSIDAMQVNGPGTIGISGWAIDPDTSNPVVVHVYVNGAFAGGAGANDSRPDVGGAFPGYGNNHGYHLNVNVAGADNQICVFALNSGPGNNGLLGCRNLAVRVDPLGALDSVTRSGDGRSMTVSGWAIDPDTSAPIDVHVYVDGAGAAATVANVARGDIGAAFPLWGAGHGYSVTVPVAPGAHQVCAYGINRPGTPGGNVILRCVTG